MEQRYWFTDLWEVLAVVTGLIGTFAIVGMLAVVLG
jgi:hypothetical protein